jgi:Low affinity iron permease
MRTGLRDVSQRLRLGIRPAVATAIQQAVMPSDVTENVGFFDRFAAKAALVASRATFFAFCVLLVVVWLPSYFLLQDLDTWQLIINTATTIVTFLMVALLQNSQTRSEQAVQHKLNAIADGLADLMDHLANGTGGRDLHQDLVELRDALGLEEHESTSHNEAVHN